MLRHKILATGVVLFSLSLAIHPAWAEFKPLSDIQVSEPVVNLYPNETAITRTVTQGQLLQVQIRYPISLPFPEAADLVVPRSQKAKIAPVGVYRAPNPVQQDGTPPILGVGYLGAWIKATGIGEAHCTVRIRMSNGTVRNIPLSFDIQAQ